MSRSGYCDDIDDTLAHGRWRAQVRSATRGKRGQKLLRDMLAALDAMPEKRLAPFELEISAEADARHAARWAEITKSDTSYYFEHVLRRAPGVREGDVCALGAVGKMRGMDMSDLDPEDPDTVAGAFDVAAPLAREIVYMNDEVSSYSETPEQRWTRMRAWVARQIID